MSNEVYRPAINEQDMDDIETALRNEVERRVAKATRADDAEEALKALQFRTRAGTIGKRFYDMRMARIQKAINVALAEEAQVTMEQAIEDAEFNARKEQAESEERADAIVDHYQSIDAA